MKKMLFLIALLFSVVCYAAPPPEKVSCQIADDVGIVVQDIQSVEIYAIAVPVVGLNVQEVTFVDIGNTVAKVSTINSDKNYNYRQNKQHDNYGYPFGGDYQNTFFNYII